ncbi:MAG: cyclic nucleotide-binding domain-containing protein [Gammaproteobacteria bacterium]|nr:cyclic nucleotide-binding domain-containing protein [Gammaproteobacteria bacterium]
MTDSTASIIASHELFADLEPRFIETLAEYASKRDVRAGENLFTQGQPATTFYLSLSGTIIVETPAIMGPSLELQSLGEGRILGWSWLIPPYKWHFQARAEEDSTVLEFDGTRLLQICEQDTAFGYQLLKRFASLMGDRLENARRRMMDAWNPSGFA